MGALILHLQFSDYVKAVGVSKELQEGSSPYGSKLRYSIEVAEHGTGKGFKVDLYSTFYATEPRQYLVLVDGKPSEKLPAASKTKVLDLIRRWLVSH